MTLNWFKLLVFFLFCVLSFPHIVCFEIKNINLGPPWPKIGLETELDKTWEIIPNPGKIII